MNTIILNLVRISRLNVLLSLLFDGLMWVVLLKSRILAWLYGRVWPLLGVKYFDQRFIWLYGPQHWEWAERGMFAYMAVTPGGVALDLACGDGFYPGLFLRRIAGAVDAVDLDAKAIALATRRYGGTNMRFAVNNMIADPFPRPDYDLVSCFATFQYLPVPDAERLTAKIAAALRKNDGMFIGSVPLFFPPHKLDPQATHNFRSDAEVQRLFQIHFGRVETWRSTWTGGLVHCYFKCSQPQVSSMQAADSAVQSYVRDFGQT